MRKLSYRRGRDYEPPGKNDRAPITEAIVPLILVVTGSVLISIKAFLNLDDPRANAVLIAALVLLMAETVLGIFAAYLTAYILGCSFGELRAAALKLTGILVFCGALVGVVRYGWIFVPFVYFGLVMWLFQLQMFETLIFSAVFAVVECLTPPILIVIGRAMS